MASDYNIPVLLKTMGVVDLISRYNEGLTFAEILEKQQLPKTTLFRILHTLETGNWIQKKGDRYTLGYMIIHYGLTGLAGRNIRLVAKPYLEELRELTSETAHLAILSGKKSMIVEVCDSRKHVKPSAPVGSLGSLYCSAPGKIFLAFSIKEDLKTFFADMELEKRTANTITEISALEDEIRKIRKNGYSIDDREYHENVRCLAAPVWGRDNEIVAAVGITATIQDFTRERIPEVSEKVTMIARKISQEMGGI